MTYIVDFMNSDHNYLESLWESFLKEKNDYKQMEICLKRYETHLLLHMKFEDEYLFKRLNEYMSMKDSALVDVVYKEHQVILKLLSLTRKAMVAKNEEKIIMTGKNLNRALKKHHAKEMKLQYPVSDAFIKADEWNRELYKIYGQKRLDKIANMVGGNTFLLDDSASIDFGI